MGGENDEGILPECLRLCVYFVGWKRHTFEQYWELHWTGGDEPGVETQIREAVTYGYCRVGAGGPLGLDPSASRGHRVMGGRWLFQAENMAPCWEQA